ncbi:MAG TPA: hypothetical protein VH251_04375, partial [Verrucomicrobiae bacterium]|nr:hypothetical protein [Verrucomicrobiae bacterium]
MKRGKQILGLLLLLVVLLAIASSARWTALPEPEYNGKKLSQWAELFQHGVHDEDSSIRDQAIYAAHQTRDQACTLLAKALAKGTACVADRAGDQTRHFKICHTASPGSL